MLHRHPLALVALFLLAAGPAFAACTAPPAPGVEWRRCLLDGRDMAGADLTGAILRDVSMGRAKLTGVNFTRVDGPDSRFVSSDLTGADFTEAVLRSADFTRATLRGAKFLRTDLRRARLFRADLTGADLTGAELDGADFAGAILEGVRWTDGQKLCGTGSVGTCQ
jgi:uncharacterized protein YjbI with pentapeptide repeats